MFTIERSRRFVRFIVGREKVILAATGFLVVLVTLGIGRVRLDTDFRAMFPDDNPTMVDFAWIEGRLGGVGDLEIVFDGTRGTERAPEPSEADRLRLDELRLRVAGAAEFDELAALSDADRDELSLLEAAEQRYLAARIGVDATVLRAFLVDLHRYVPLHPFIESIQDMPEDDRIPTARRYRVVDRIPVGPFKLKTVYVAALEPVAPDEVHGHAWQSPGIRLRTIYGIEAIRSGTRLRERCFVDAGRLMRGYVVRQARTAWSAWSMGAP